jgi:hypothetical protein
MTRYNPFAEQAGMTKVCESKPDKSILKAMLNSKLGFTPYLLVVPEYNKRTLKKRVPQVKIFSAALIILTTEELLGRMGNSQWKTTRNG